MSFSGYRGVWAIPDARRILVLSLVCRIPLAGAVVLITLHVVENLDPRYSAAGVISMAATIAMGLSGPWRGRLLDRQGLRRTLLPSLIIGSACWLIAPWSPYWLLLVLVIVSGLYTVPIFALSRQVLLGAVATGQRRVALAFDAVLTEIAFMSGPILAIWATSVWGTAWTLLVFQLLCLGGAALIFVVNPPLRARTTAPEDARSERWLTPVVWVVLGLTLVITVTLTATDLAVVAGLRAMGHSGSIGVVIAVWAFGSAVGGVCYGLIRRPIAAWAMVALLGVTTLPVGLTDSRWSMMGWLFIAGLFCAPAITATSETLSHLVPESARGEAFGWHGTALTAGTAVAAPIVGLAIDRWGWSAGFLTGGGITLVAALATGLALGVRPNGRRGKPHPEETEAASRGGPTHTL